MFNETSFGDDVVMRSCAGSDPACGAGNFNPRKLPIQGGGPCEPLETAVDVGADTAVCMNQEDLASFMMGSRSALDQLGRPAGDKMMLWIGVAAVAFVVLSTLRR